MSQRGFTLIEMAMVFVLVGFLVGGGLFALTPVLDRTRINQTNATLDQVENALILFVIRNNRLPCPADGSNISGATTYGLEQYPNSATVITGGDCSVAVSNAVIPWKTLGMDEAYSIDGWGIRISYYPAKIGVAGANPPASPAGSITTNPNLKRSGTTYPTGPFMTVTDAVTGKAVTPAAGTPTTAVNPYDQAAYVLISHGKTGWYGWNKSGTLLSATSSAPSKACNSNPTCGTTINTITVSDSFLSGGPVGNPTSKSSTYFDDIVRWRSPNMIIQLCGSGSCGNP